MAKVFNPGEFRHEIMFLSPPGEKDDYGEYTGDWIEFKRKKASKEPLLGRELYIALTEDTKVEVKFRMRWFGGVTDGMRIRHGEEIYKIISAVDVKSAHKELICYCRLVK